MMAGRLHVRVAIAGIAERAAEPVAGGDLVRATLRWGEE